MVPAVTATGSVETDSDTKKTAKDIASRIIAGYQKQEGFIPGLLGEDYFFGTDGMMWKTFVDYWALTGDESFADVTKEA